MADSKLATLAGFRVMAQDGDLLRLRGPNESECVIRYDDGNSQVYSVGPDSPQGGTWLAHATLGGIEYVSTWVSPSAARRRFAVAATP